MKVKVYATEGGAGEAGERGGRWGKSRRNDVPFIPRATGPFYTASPHPVTDATRLLNASCDRRVGGYDAPSSTAGCFFLASTIGGYVVAPRGWVRGADVELGLRVNEGDADARHMHCAPAENLEEYL